MATKVIEQIIEMPPLPEENPKFDEPWKHVVDESMKTEDDVHHSFTEIFAQLYLKDNQDPPESSSPSLYTLSPSSSLSSDHDVETKPHLHAHSDSISSCNSEHSSICDDVVDCNIECDREGEGEEIHRRCHASKNKSRGDDSKRWRRKNGGFPPPISCIGRNGKPWVTFQRIRKDGRFVLMGVTQGSMHACRQDGRLKLQIVQSDDEEEDQEEEKTETKLDGNGEMGEIKGEEDEE